MPHTDVQMSRRPWMAESDEKQGWGLPMHKKAAPLRERLSLNKSLAMSYSHMGRPHTTIGAERFHFRVRKGIGWFPLAIAARQTGIALNNLKISDAQVSHYMSH